MLTIATHPAETDVSVTCPENGVPCRVTMGWDSDGDPVVIGCSRFWGDLRCDAECWGDAVGELDLMERYRSPPMYCGHPNLGAPRPREG